MAQFDTLDPDRIKTGLKTTNIPTRVLVYSSTTSTNDIAWEYAKNKTNNGLVIFAEEQTAGRGRAGTRWFGGRAESILCSIVLTDFSSTADLLTLSLAVAAAEAIDKVGPHEPKIKWPNDIILNQRKLAGLMVESKTADAGTDYVLGIGINCHQKKPSFPTELRQTVTSIDIESRTICDRVSLARRLLVSIDDWLITAVRDSEKVIEQWRHLSTQLGHRVTLSYNNRQFSGNCIGLDPQHGLVLQLDTGGVRMFDAAHATIVR